MPDLHNEDRLWSLYKSGITWPVGKRLEAHCIQAAYWGWGAYQVASKIDLPPHDAPSPLCSCGIYGLNSPLGEEEIRPWQNDAIVGLTFIWGHVLEGERGYRGQYAKIACLLGQGDDEQRTRVARMADIYMVPVIEDLHWELDRHRKEQGG